MTKIIGCAFMFAAIIVAVDCSGFILEISLNENLHNAQLSSIVVLTMVQDVFGNVQNSFSVYSESYVLKQLCWTDN